MRPDDVLIITADHGCDPSTPGTDHSREYIPIIVCGDEIKAGVNIGTHPTFADISASVLDCFGLPALKSGESFLREVSDI